MARIDRNKLAAFAKSGKEKDDDEEDDKAPESSPAKEKAEADAEPETDFKEWGGGKYGALIPMLEEYHEEVEECGDVLNGALLASIDEDMDDDDRADLAESLQELHPKLRKELKSLKGVKLEAAEKIAGHLLEEDMIEDSDSFASLLVRIGEVV